MTEQQKEIQDSNVLLAVFMGLIYRPCGGYLCLDSQEVISVDNLTYNEDWQMLMQVVERIEEINIGRQLLFEVIIHGSESWVYAHDSIGKIKRTDLRDRTMITEKTKIEATYYACVAFVKWWSKNKHRICKP